jgi:vancomycin resistance protein YoaR
MQAAPPIQAHSPNRLRHLGFFMIAPLTAVIILLILAGTTFVNYSSQHNGRVFTGVSVLGEELSGLTQAEAQAALSAAFPYPQATAISLTDPASGQQWTLTPAELGLTFDAAATAQAAYEVGRSGDPISRAKVMFDSWYYGRTLAPVLILDEAKLDQKLAEVAAEINRPPVNAALDIADGSSAYVAGQNGRFLDTADARQRLLPALSQFRAADLELLVHETPPTVADTGDASAEIQQLIGSPITFYLEAPLDEFDLQPITLSSQDLSAWLRVEVQDKGDGTMQHNAFLDENAVRHWLRQFEDTLYRAPVNARFYFDDATEELVLVAPHVNGRELDIEATIAQLKAQAGSPNRSVPFVVKDIVPIAHSGATAVELGITELITQSTTWFSGSSPARKHNIATAAANFYGIVIAPYEEFSFNKYLGSISESDGYEEGLIIVGGLTIKGVGGGICQVSTTLYQTAFFGGYPITERLPHGYMLGYYRDGAGHGMDATVYSPIVDMKFINNTPHHLLIENYYDTEHEALTFKFYSTSLGRRVEKELLPWENVVPPVEEDTWTFDETLEPGTVRQVDWQTEGADVTVTRIVYNADGVPLYGPIEYFTSHYIPVGDVYHYGPGVEPYDYSLVPDEDH